jgi:hypothetical protein
MQPFGIVDFFDELGQSLGDACECLVACGVDDASSDYQLHNRHRNSCYAAIVKMSGSSFQCRTTPLTLPPGFIQF